VAPTPELVTYETASPSAALVLAHGAGAGQSSPFMTNFARGMAARGIATLTFDFPYMAARRKVPDPAPVLEACWLGAIEATRQLMPKLPVFIGGKSMGGRIASQVAAGPHPPIAGLVFLGYPLHPPGKPAQRRDAHLPRVAEPMLFVQGSRDAFGTAEEIRGLLPRLTRAALHEVAGGDHSLKPGSRRIDPQNVMAAVMDLVADWMGAALRDGR
jgi:hypothetical protein